MCIIIVGFGQDVDNMYRCPNHLSRTIYLKAFKDKCYRFEKSEMYWTSARDRCSGEQGTLIQIRNQETQNWVVNTLNALHWSTNGVWLGIMKWIADGLRVIIIVLSTLSNKTVAIINYFIRNHVTLFVIYWLRVSTSLSIDRLLAGRFKSLSIDRLLTGRFKSLSIDRLLTGRFKSLSIDRLVTGRFKSLSIDSLLTGRFKSLSIDRLVTGKFKSLSINRLLTGRFKSLSIDLLLAKRFDLLQNRCQFRGIMYVITFHLVLSVFFLMSVA